MRIDRAFGLAVVLAALLPFVRLADPRSATELPETIEMVEEGVGFVYGSWDTSVLRETSERLAEHMREEDWDRSHCPLTYDQLMAVNAELARRGITGASR